MDAIEDSPRAVAHRRSDAYLLARTRSDPNAFGSFYDRYERPIMGYLLHRTRDVEVAADLTAEVFAAALVAAPRYRAENRTAAAWLFTIANHVLSKSRRRGRVDASARRRLGLEEAIRFEAGELGAAEIAVSDDSWALELLERLPADQREAVRARILDDRSYGDIAGELDTSEMVVRKRVSRGLRRLRAELERAG